MLSFPLFEFYVAVNQGIRLYSQKFYQNQRILRVRKARRLRTFCVLEVFFVFGEIFVNLLVLLQLDYIEDSPKLL